MTDKSNDWENSSKMIKGVQEAFREICQWKNQGDAQEEKQDKRESVKTIEKTETRTDYGTWT